MDKKFLVVALAGFLAMATPVLADILFERPTIIWISGWKSPENMTDLGFNDTLTWSGYSRHCGTSSCAGWPRNAFISEVNYDHVHENTKLWITYLCTPNKAGLTKAYHIYNYEIGQWTALPNVVCDGLRKTQSFDISSEYLNGNKLQFRYLGSTYYPRTTVKIYDIYSETG